MPGKSKPRPEPRLPRAVTRVDRALREHRDRWHAATDPQGRFAAAVGWVKAAVRNTHDDRALVDQAALQVWAVGERLNKAAIDRAEKQQRDAGEG